MPITTSFDIRIYQSPSCVTTQYLSINDTISTGLIYGDEILLSLGVLGTGYQQMDRKYVNLNCIFGIYIHELAYIPFSKHFHIF